MSLDEARFVLVETLDDIDRFRRWLGERRPILGLDIETTGLRLARDRIRLVQFGDAREGYAIPWDTLNGVVRDVLNRYTGPLVLQHAKFDAGFLQREGVVFPWERVHDTMPMLFLDNSLGPKSLKQGAALHVDPRARAGEQELKSAMKRNGWDYDTVPIEFEPYWAYACLDTVLTAQLAEKLWPAIQPYREAYELELKCQRVLCDMEAHGVAIDVGYCERTREKMQDDYQEVLERLGDVNPNAHDEVVSALIQTGATLTKRTESGKLAVDDEVLSALVSQGSQTASDILAARWMTKMLSTYFDNFLEYHVNGILHPHINQLAARTGRMSVTEPALQTIPRKAIIRDAFIPQPGNKLALIDYDNQELRMAAHFSGDANMIAAFERGASLHDETARRLYGEGYTREQRGKAKNAMFSKAYGASAQKFARTAGVPLEEAAAIYRTLDELYPGMHRIMQQVTTAVQSRLDHSCGLGYVKLIDGRHLKVKFDKAYIGFNALIQGSCAVVLKQTLVDLHAAGFGTYINLPIHDEVMFDIPAEDVDEVVPEIARVMTRNEFRVPLTVSPKIVDRWGDPYREE